MNRTWDDRTLYVPTRVDTEQCRHIIIHKDGAPLCGVACDGAQYVPTTYQRRALCPRCVQQHSRALRGMRLEDLW